MKTLGQRCKVHAWPGRQLTADSRPTSWSHAAMQDPSFGHEFIPEGGSGSLGVLSIWPFPLKPRPGNPGLPLTER